MLFSREKRFTRDEIHGLIRDLTDGKASLSPHLHKLIDHFIDDLDFFLYKDEINPSTHERVARFDPTKMKVELLEIWLRMIEERFEFFFYQLPNPTDREQMKKTYNTLEKKMLVLTGRYTSHPLYEVFFSQKTCTANFAEHTSISKKDFPFTGRPLLEAAAALSTDPLLVDEVVVRIAHVHTAHQSQWVALNNRGLAVCNLAQVRPLRWRPDVLTADELKRLSEEPGSLNLAYYPGADATSFVFLDNIDKKNARAPFASITGINNGEKIFSVYHYVRGLDTHLAKHGVTSNFTPLAESALSLSKLSTKGKSKSLEIA
jgi:hypothetical protein